MTDRKQNLKNWQSALRTNRNGMVDPKLMESHAPERQFAILHDNPSAINRYFQNFKAPNGYSCDPPEPIQPTDNIRFTGKRVTFDNGGTKSDILYVATFMGAPNTAIVVHELQAWGIDKIIKVGTASGLTEGLKDGDILVPAVAAADEGTSKWNHYDYAANHHTLDSYFDNVRGYPCDESLRSEIIKVLATDLQVMISIHKKDDVAIWSVDSYPTFIICTDLYPLNVQGASFMLQDNSTKVRLLGVEMECSALFSAATMLNISAAALIVISRTRDQMAAPAKGQQLSRDARVVQSSELSCFEAATKTLLRA